MTLDVKNLKVLVVHDDEMIFQKLKEHLLKLGVRDVSLSISYKDAKAFIKEKDFNLLVVSQEILGEDAYSLYNSIEEKSELRGKFIIMKNGEDNASIPKELFSSSLDQNYNIEELSSVLKRVLDPSQDELVKGKEITEHSRILVVDDFEMLRITMKRALGNLGFDKVDEAEDGESAWQKILKASANGEPYHIIFSDWTMPGMNGMELFKKCNENDNIKGTPFVMVTAESEKKNVMAALSAGVTEYIIKPCTVEGVQQKILTINKKLKA